MTKKSWQSTLKARGCPIISQTVWNQIRTIAAAKIRENKDINDSINLTVTNENLTTTTKCGKLNLG